MMNEKMKELYQSQQKTAQKSLETQIKGEWYKDPFVKKIIIAVVAILAVSVIAEIVFLLYESSQIDNTMNVFKMHL